MLHRMSRTGLAPALVLLAAACTGDQPTDPDSFAPARGGGNGPLLTATPGSLALTIPTATTGLVTATVQFVGVITSATSDASCATVSPHDVPAGKPKGSSVYVATFTITAIEAGDCTVTLTDKQGGTATVAVEVRERPAVDGTRLVYAIEEGLSGTYHLYTSNPDGSDRVQVTTGEGSQFSPVFLPDRSKIVYVSDEAGSTNLFWVNPDGTGKEQLTFYEIGTHSGAGVHEPAVSPDGTQIAFELSTGFVGRPSHIHVMDAVPGAIPVAITASNALNASPVYTPDGRIVFTSHSFAEEHPDGGEHHSIWIMAANGANLTRLTHAGGGSHRFPAVSPDGMTIAFSGTPGNVPSHIALVDIDGGNQRALTSGTDITAVFSPNGKWIAFRRVLTPGPLTGNPEIFALKLGRPESEAVNITSSSVFESVHPDWR